MFDWRDYGDGIVAFDAGYVRPILAAIHLVVENGRVAFIDTGSNDALPNALAALKRLDLDVGAVDFVILTHIHLDHAGGAGLLMKNFPNAQLVVHSRGARHMAEPSKLVAGVSAVYGREYVEHVYGDILPTPSGRIIEAHEGMRLSLAGRSLLIVDTPGHARHHICIVDEKTKGIFTGDMFGLSYRELDVDGEPFVFPTTSPTQFDPVEMHASIDRLVSFNPSAMYLTHYGQVGNVREKAKELKAHLDALVSLALLERGAGLVRHENIKSAITAYLLGSLRAHGCVLPESQLLDLWATDIDLNAKGLGVWLDTLPH